MSKPKGTKSYIPLTIDEIKAALGGRTDIPVKVSKSWLESVREIFGGAGASEPEAEGPEGDDEEETADKGKGGVSIEE